jgi:methyltransferase (TIGR00027 family)
MTESTSPGLTKILQQEGSLRPDRIATGLLVATVLRLTDMSRPPEKRVLNDPFGRQFLPPAFRLLLLPGVRQALIAFTRHRMAGTIGMLLCRTRTIDDALRDALSAGCRQVVNLGAGFDTRAFRIPGIEQAHVFELDRAAPQAWKAARLRQVLGELPAHVSFVPIDFNTQDLETTLDQSGFRAGLPTFFIWEGVTQYITPAAVDRTLAFVAAQATGSQIIFTYVKRNVVEGMDRTADEQRLIEQLQKGGAPFIFGIDPAELEDFLRERGLTLIDHLSAEDYRQRYLVPLGRQEMPIFDSELMALARV